LPALAPVPDWVPSPEAAPRPADPKLDARPGETRVSSREDDLAELGSDWPQRFARVLTEALAGARPARQILPWTSKRAQSQFLRLVGAFGSGAPSGTRQAAGSFARASGQPRIVRVLATRPTRDAIEMSVIAGFGERTRALALRLERTAREDSPCGWLCTDIEAA
jgi:hypothetical protein